MIDHAVVIADGGPVGMLPAGELALSGVDLVVLERRESQDLVGSRAGGLQSRAIELLDQRSIAGRFLAEGNTVQVASFASVPLDISDFPTRHPYALGLWQKHMRPASWPAGFATSASRLNTAVR
jgi:2-polyprenyl-6-methoxyphenol hydroxylase-like FAD-dependent oxidoreductase